jgi:hypothetical protein
MMPPIMASISKKSSNKVPIIIFRCYNSYIMGDEPIMIEQFFYGFEGVIMGSITGSQNIMGSDYGSNISVVNMHLMLVPQGTLYEGIFV